MLLTTINLSSDLRIPKLGDTYNNKYKTTGIIDTNLEYPRSNNSLREIHKEQWLKYYACLIKQHTQIKSQKMLYPIALIVLEGTSVILKCKMCISPLIVYEVDTIEWYFNSSNDNNVTNELIQPTKNILFSQNNKNLQMYNIQLEQDGKYWCQMKDTIGPLYYLHVDNGNEGIDIVYPDVVPNVKHAASSKIIKEYNLKIYTAWMNWSPCSKCDNVGIKIRYGYCILSLLENPLYHADSGRKLNTETPIIWKVGTKVLPFLKYHSNSKIFINSRMRIVFKKLKFADNNIYSCWQNNQLAGTVRLIVTGEKELEFNYQYMMFGTIAIVSVFTVVIWRVLKSKIRFTKH
ncbi:hypothetical protein M0802_005079 [Mischocyttarus mexicanus]|nr:hypothetical protein M0802_005079 [Mischocyttarus mexicanus]